jgi:3-methyladenine DNA glycosylase AlkC
VAITADDHPIQQFTPPRAIQKGHALKELLDGRLVTLVGASFQNVHPDFPLSRYTRQAKRGLADLELSDRARHIAAALRKGLPEQASAAMQVMVHTLGPRLERTDEIGLQPFFYLPHGHLLAELGPQAIEQGLTACYELTQRFTAEFAIRPLLLSDQERALTQLLRWCDDPNPHVRRLVSEGTRPRLPWAQRLPAFIADPAPTLHLLERLRHDRDRYVQRSVANHLGDIAKDHLELVFDTCQRWLHEAVHLPETNRQDIHWLIRHALRHPDKKGHQRARSLRREAGGKARSQRKA